MRFSRYPHRNKHTLIGINPTVTEKGAELVGGQRSPSPMSCLHALRTLDNHSYDFLCIYSMWKKFPEFFSKRILCPLFVDFKFSLDPIVCVRQFSTWILQTKPRVKNATKHTNLYLFLHPEFSAVGHTVQLEFRTSFCTLKKHCPPTSLSSPT